jgi:hypothetical protein
MNSRLTAGIICLAAQLVAARPGLAQHPVEVQRLAASGDYFVALTTFDKMPKRVATSQSILAAARSAWALGLSARALEEFDKALRDETLSEEDKARVHLSKGIIEFQEGRFQIASLHAEKSIVTLDALEKAEPSPLRAKAYLLWGDSLAKLTSFGEAEDKYIKALDDASPEDKPQIHYSLGKCRVQLSKYEQARENFENVPLNHELTPEAIRGLASIALDTGKFASAAFWLNKGRTDYPDNFLDSWVDYALMRIAVNQNSIQHVREIRQTAAKKYPPSDHWLVLLQAAAESFEWDQLQSANAKKGA